jgi:predicted  nucleic acid-binding Zn-ribbon protein
MKKLLLPILFLALLSIPCPAEDRRPDRTVLTIMTLNGEFLWDGVAPEVGSADFPWKHSRTEAEEHMRQVAEIIIRSDPDVINLVEVENIAALRAFNDTFLAGRGYRPYLDQGRDSAAGQDVALLTRIDPENNSVKHDERLGHSGAVSKSVSKNYVARFTGCDIQRAGSSHINPTSFHPRKRSGLIRQLPGRSAEL